MVVELTFGKFLHTVVLEVRFVRVCVCVFFSFMNSIQPQSLKDAVEILKSQLATKLTV